MSFRVVVVESSAKLDFKMNYLVVRSSDVKKVVISEIDVLIIESTATSITSALLCELVKNKVKVIFCDEKRNPLSELTPYYGSHDTSLKIKMQNNWSNIRKQITWTSVVCQKITNQMYLLKSLKLDEYKFLEHYISEIEFNDGTNREGHAAKVYFNALFSKEFTRNTPSHINSALNYGYSILLSAFNREIVALGYSTTVGIFHDNMYNQYNLSSDLMEPFRPLIDKAVHSMELEKFETEEKHNLVNILNSQVIIDEQKQYLINAIKIYLRSVFDVLNGVDGAEIKVYRNEL